MSAAIILFWFVEGGVALRYFVCTYSSMRTQALSSLAGSFHRCHVLHVRSLGRCWCVTLFSLSLNNTRAH